MATKRKVTATKAIPNVSERVEELASTMVLGGTDSEQWATLLSSMRAEAVTAGRADVAGIAAQALDALSKGPGADAFEAIVSDSITQMQRALADGSAKVAPLGEPAELSTPSAPAQTSVPAAPSQSLLSMSEDPEMVGDFILESREHLTQVEIHMMTLEKDPGESEAINTVFRAFHTIKGLAGFMDLNEIRQVAHETETLLDLARNRKLRITSPVVDVVLAAADFLKVWLKRLEIILAGGDPGLAPEMEALLERIRRGAVGESEVAVEEVKVTASADEAEMDFPDRRKAAAADGSGGDRRSNDGDRRTQVTETRSVKVDTAKLDFLVDMAGEMVIAQSMVRHHPELAALRSPAVLRNLAQLARITGDLQKTAMSMRMVPVGGLFQKMSRLVRDLARKTGKQAEMEAIGGETELDRNVVEELADPLMHMVRNAADHGVEPPDERRAAGKDPTGRIRLRASHQAGHIVIEIADDGRGLIREKILEKARRTGLVEDGANLSDSEVFNFIFHPGFSTAEKVTDVSGRGVGMDVVKKQIQKLRGRIDIESTPGKGSSFFLRLPLTLAMIDGLVVGVGGERYVVPIFSVREMLRPTAEMVFTVENRQEMAMVRNSLLPVVRLYRRFGVEPRSEVATESLLIVAEAAGKSFCLMVDELIGKQEVVIKSLGETLKDIPGVAGGAILGDGRVGLILDLEGIFRARVK
ncbi:MAG TPA: chemotaxis protein CheA [Terracidiphilus sp.]|nr:chemotaxis protein CheA [Terracidiphilus sp.]